MKKYIKKIKSDIFIRLFFHALYIVSIAALPYTIKNLIDCKFHNGVYDIIKWISIYILFAALGMCSQYITQQRAWKVDQKLFEDIRDDLFKAIICKNPKDFYSKDVGDYSSMMNNEISSCIEYFEYIMQSSESAISLLIYAVFLFILDYRIACIIYITAVLSLLLPKITGRKFSEKKNKLMDETAAYITKIIDLLNGYSVINCITSNNISQRHKTALSSIENTRYNYGKFKALVNVLNGCVMYLIDAGILAVIAVLLFNQTITAGIATAAISYIQSFMFPLRTIIDTISGIKSVTGIKNKIMHEINSATPIVSDKINLKYAIYCKNISFRYKNFSIENFSYTFEKGKKYAIVGPSGCGKSTILNLLTGLISAADGEITIDDTPVSYWLCQNSLMYLNQQPHIFSESFVDNTTIFNSYRDKLISKQLIIDEKIQYLSEFPDCTVLSGGERQLISFARVINSGFNVIIMDEPFSALDPRTEFEICHKLTQDKNKTVIMVTHNENSDFLSLFDDVIYLNNT